MELTIENLKNMKCADIALFRNNTLVDVISKDITCNFAPYTIGGSDNIFDEKEIIKLCKDDKYYIFDAKLINKPVETTNEQPKIQCLKNI